MQDVGDKLREARMRQGIDITDVESVTKIRAKYLRAIEDGEFDLLPGPTYVRSFLRTYAEHLGLDPHLIVQEYRDRHETHRDDEVQSFAMRKGTIDHGRRGPGPGLVVAGVLLALLAFFFVLGRTGDPTRGSA
jgi:cytoskeletal protein RodZ